MHYLCGMEKKIQDVLVHLTRKTHSIESAQNQSIIYSRNTHFPSYFVISNAEYVYSEGKRTHFLLVWINDNIICHDLRLICLKPPFRNQYP